MTQEDKELLLKDLCARLPYRVKCIVNGLDDCTLLPSDIEEEREIKPYLRPMTSMTEEEREEYQNIIIQHSVNLESWHEVDFLNKHYLDYRGLIDKGLAIAVTKENNPYKE